MPENFKSDAKYTTHGADVEVRPAADRVRRKSEPASSRGIAPDAPTDQRQIDGHTEGRPLISTIHN